MQLCKLVMVFVALLLALYLSAANDVFPAYKHILDHSSLLTS